MDNNNTLTEEKLAELKKTANEMLAEYRSGILQTHPFIGTVAMKMNLIAIRDKRVDTACTDGTSVYVDIDFLSQLSDSEREFVLAHEFWHNVMLHFARRESRDAQLFNLATDMEVNQLLSHDGFTAPNDAVFPNSDVRQSCFHFPSNLSAEEYYELLLKESEKCQKQNENGSERSQSGKTGRSKSSSKINGQFDKHIYEDGIGNSSEKIYDKYGEKGEDPDFNPSMEKAEIDKAVEKMREAVVSAAQQAEKSNRGNLPEYIKKIVDQLLRPEISWKELLAAEVTSVMANKTNWNRPSRRFAYSGTYLPSHTGESIHVAVGIDTSGSVYDKANKFLAEVNGIASSFDGYEIHLIQCDTEVKRHDVFSEDAPFEDEIKKVPIEGNGGTELHPIMDYIEEHELDIDTLIMFTDGECENFEEADTPEGYNVIWVFTEKGDFDNIKFGQKIFFQNA